MDNHETTAKTTHRELTWCHVCMFVPLKTRVQTGTTVHLRRKVGRCG
jgi:hypothetical protein